jgi:hypothetical protein
VLSRHQPGDTVRYSEIIPLQQALGLSAGRTSEVLQEMGVLDDDRRPSFEDWLERKLDGGPRSRPRDIATAWNHMDYLRPVLLAWSSQYGHLREVTRGDVLAVLGELHGSRRSNVLVALRSLFAFCKRQKTIFRSPVQGIPVGQRTWGIIQPLSQDEVGQAAEAAATPAARLVLVLAAMHAARVKAIREIRLDDVDLGSRRIVIGGRARPLDDLTRQVLLEWLAHRGTRWPSTASPHLLASQQGANGTGPVSTSYFARTALRGKAATLSGEVSARRLVVRWWPDLVPAVAGSLAPQGNDAGGAAAGQCMPRQLQDPAIRGCSAGPKPRARCHRAGGEPPPRWPRRQAAGSR